MSTRGCKTLRGLLAGFAVLFAARPGAAEPIPGQWIAVFRDSVEDVEGAADRVARGAGAERGAVWRDALKGFAFRGSPRAAEAVRRSREVAFVEPDRRVEAFCHTGSQEIPDGVVRVGATDSPTAQIDGIDQRVNADIAILDTGIYPHGDLNEEGGKHWDCASFKGCTKLSSPKDDNGHGTHVAGTAAAIDDSRGVVGVAPGARLWSIKVLGRSGSGSWSWVINGLNVVAQNGAAIEVANLSLGGASEENPAACDSSSLHLAVCNVVRKGVAIVAAAGNEASDASGTVPAKYPEVIAVSAIDPKTDQFADFSNFGAAIALAAPGVGILSTWPGDKRSPWGYCATADGTSMAAPHVAGGIALWTARFGRDCNGDGSIDARDVECLRQRLLASGTCFRGGSPVEGLCGTPWPGDPDGMGEPLLDVSGF